MANKNFTLAVILLLVFYGILCFALPAKLTGRSLHAGDTSAKMETHANDNNIIISKEIPNNGSLPDKCIIDTLIYQSHVQLILSSCYTDTSDHNYPDIIFIANDIVKTFSFVWLPDDWDHYPDNKKRMIIHLHGHCGIGTKHFCKWYELAQQKNIAVLSLQYWMGGVNWCGGNPKPDGDYSYYITGPSQTCGWHLNIETDIYPFIDKLMEYYDVHSVMLHGFSMAAATSVIVDFRDKQDRDLIDFTIFNAGNISSNHYFYQEIESNPDNSPFRNENYFFFLENIDANIYAQQSFTREFLIEKGVNEIETVIAEDGDYQHGALINNEDFLPVRERIISLYDSLTTTGVLASIAISPDSVTLLPGETQQFTATGADPFGNTVIFQPIWSAEGGSIDNSGFYTAGQDTGYFQIMARDTLSSIEGVAIVHIRVSTGVTAEESELPKEFALGQNYPNPFNPVTAIEYAVKQACHVVLKVFDIRGREVATLVDGHHPAGFYKASFNTRHLASGVYFYRICMKDFVAVRKMVVLE